MPLPLEKVLDLVRERTAPVKATWRFWRWWAPPPMDYGHVVGGNRFIVFRLKGSKGRRLIFPGPAEPALFGRISPSPGGSTIEFQVGELNRFLAIVLWAVAACALSLVIADLTLAGSDSGWRLPAAAVAFGVTAPVYPVHRLLTRGARRRLMSFCQETFGTAKP
jgi:hypothetical protein